MNDFIYFALYCVIAALIINRRRFTRIRAAVRVNHALVSHVRRLYTFAVPPETLPIETDRSGRIYFSGVQNDATNR